MDLYHNKRKYKEMIE